MKTGVDKRSLADPHWAAMTHCEIAQTTYG
jgi:hypothetical protein